jgi:hypothetical protein
MDREKKEKIAVFRFGVIFPLVEKDLHQYWGEKERILRELVSKEWEIPFSTRTYISKATILAWVKRYEDGGRKIEALFPERRGDKGRMRSITDEQIDELMLLRKSIPNYRPRVWLKLLKETASFRPEKRFPWPAFTGS